MCPATVSSDSRLPGGSNIVLHCPQSSLLADEAATQPFRLDFQLFKSPDVRLRHAPTVLQSCFGGEENEVGSEFRAYDETDCLCLGLSY